MKNSWSYLKDSGDFLKKMKNISSIPEDTISDHQCSKVIP